jgi:hypothetical protein
VRRPRERERERDASATLTRPITDAPLAHDSPIALFPIESTRTTALLSSCDPVPLPSPRQNPVDIDHEDRPKPDLMSLRHPLMPIEASYTQKDSDVKPWVVRVGFGICWPVWRGQGQGCVAVAILNSYSETKDAVQGADRVGAGLIPAPPTPPDVRVRPRKRGVARHHARLERAGVRVAGGGGKRGLAGLAGPNPHADWTRQPADTIRAAQKPAADTQRRRESRSGRDISGR